MNYIGIPIKRSVIEGAMSVFHHAFTNKNELYPLFLSVLCLKLEHLLTLIQ